MQRHVPGELSNKLRSVTMSAARPAHAEAILNRKLDVVRFLASTPATKQLEDSLKQIGWEITENEASFDSLNSNSIVLIMDDLTSALLPTIAENQWESLKALTQVGASWVTEGSQLDVTKPDRAMAHGLLRTVRAEDPSVSVTTLDVESASSSRTMGAVNTILKSIQRPAPTTHVDNEYVERDGIISICRILPDH